MANCVFNTCCGCIELRTGCLILGYLKLVGELIFFVISLMALIAGGVVAGGAESQDDKNAGVFIMAIGIVLLIAVIFSLTSTIVLLVGVHKEKRGHIKAFLIIACILLVLYIISFFAGLAHPGTIGDIFGKIINIGLNIYFLLVIRSHYYKMQEKAPAYNTA